MSAALRLFNSEATNPVTLTDASTNRDGGYSQHNDERLLALMREGDSRAFDEIFGRYRQQLVSYAAKYLQLPDWAQDVAQEVFLKLLATPPETLKDGKLGPWLFRVTRNLAIDRGRRQQREVAAVSEFHLEILEDRTPFTASAATNDAEELNQLVTRLAPEYRQVIELHIGQNLSFKEIAEQTQTPLGTVLWRMHRALGELRKLVRESDLLR